MFRPCGLRFAPCPRGSSRFAASNGQRPGRECIFTFRTDPQFSMVVPLRSQARVWLSLLHWAYYGLFPPLAAAFVRPCASLARCSVPAHFVCSALQPFGPSPFCKHLLPKNARNDVHAVISDLSLVLPRLCQYSERERASALSRSPLGFFASLQFLKTTEVLRNFIG